MSATNQTQSLDNAMQVYTTAKQDALVAKKLTCRIATQKYNQFVKQQDIAYMVRKLNSDWENTKELLSQNLFAKSMAANERYNSIEIAKETYWLTVNMLEKNIMQTIRSNA